MPVGDHALLQQSVDIIRKIAKIDELLQEDDNYSNRFILEMTLQEPGHPEGPVFFVYLGHRCGKAGGASPARSLLRLQQKRSLL
ncbi:hypothetical protein J6524_18550 [Bradyrhizobium sp. WSM 1738]|uniref:hypothetical protein n=1 Tax=Bradyrhizobium hereditatis TaxID=2821405 RepID=UPI001CE3B547|nr:hypothetical protein [Bradyrhizobium hereditatis]MCA6116872.1 hypothetical protein [Bradyrhizobium hereditatis]